MIDKLTGKTNFLKLIKGSLEEFPPARCYAQLGKRRAVHDMPRADSLRFHADGGRNHALDSIARPQEGDVIDSVEQRKNRPHLTAIWQ